MKIAFRMFLIDQDDGLHRLSTAMFTRMLHNPNRHRMARFAGRRVRKAQIALEIKDRQPIRVVRTVYSILVFDEQGALRIDEFNRQQRAKVELALAPVFGAPRRTNVVRAASKFIEQGGRWTPSATVARLVRLAAMGRAKCLRL